MAMVISVACCGSIVGGFSSSVPIQSGGRQPSHPAPLTALLRRPHRDLQSLRRSCVPLTTTERRNRRGGKCRVGAAFASLRVPYAQFQSSSLFEWIYPFSICPYGFLSGLFSSSLTFSIRPARERRFLSWESMMWLKRGMATESKYWMLSSLLGLSLVRDFLESNSQLISNQWGLAAVHLNLEQINSLSQERTQMPVPEDFEIMIIWVRNSRNWRAVEVLHSV